MLFRYMHAPHDTDTEAGHTRGNKTTVRNPLVQW
jgi:hypothetical protein